MFLKQSILKKLMKDAYKTGLIVARPFSDELFIADRHWQLQIKEKFIPKETKGNLIALVGELPAIGERYLATTAGNQLEYGKQMGVNDHCNSESLVVTNIKLRCGETVDERIIQDRESGQIYLLNQMFVDMIDGTKIMDEDGESMPQGPYLADNKCVIWRNDVSILKVATRWDEENKAVLEQLKGLNLMGDDA